MKEIKPQAAIDVYWKELVYTQVRLGADPKTEHLAGVIVDHLVKYDELSRADREIQRAIVENQAYARATDERVGEGLREVQSAALYLVKQDRKNMHFSQLFSTKLTPLLRLKPLDQKAEIERMQNVLKRGGYEDSFRDEQIHLLDQAVVEIDKAKARDAVLEERKFEHEQKVEAWKHGANKVRRDIYADLIKLSESSSLSWVHSFFPVHKKVKKLSAEEKAKKEAARVKKRLQKAADEFEQLTSVSMQAEKKAAMEQAKAEIEARFKQQTKQGDNKSDESSSGTDPQPGSDSPAPDVSGDLS